MHHYYQHNTIPIIVIKENNIISVFMNAGGSGASKNEGNKKCYLYNI